MLNIAFLMSCLIISSLCCCAMIIPPVTSLYIMYVRVNNKSHSNKILKKRQKRKPVHKQWIFSLVHTREGMNIKKYALRNEYVPYYSTPLPNCIQHIHKNLHKCRICIHWLWTKKICWMFVPSFMCFYLYLLFSIIEMVLNSYTYVSFAHINCICAMLSTWCALKKILHLFHVFNP